MPLLVEVWNALLDPASQMQNQLEQRWSYDQIPSVSEAGQSLTALQKEIVHERQHF
jgi:hypothetical protein